MPDSPPPPVLALLYAGPQGAVCRGRDGGLVVRAVPRPEEPVVLTQSQVLAEGVEVLLRLAA